MKMMRIFFLSLTLLTFIQGLAQKPEVIYHVFQRSFFDSNGDGHGDLRGMEQKLDYLQDLGVTSILLMPLYQSAFYHNYFATDFEKIDKEFGDMDEYLSLVKAIHRRGMKIYQDVEMQYVTGAHPWFAESFGNPSSEFARYVYYDDDAKEKPWYFWGVEEFTIHDGTKHKIAVVNMNEPRVRTYTRDLLAFWIDPNSDGVFDDGVDGFRLDHMMDDLDNAGKLTNLFETFWTPVLSDLKQINPHVKIIAEQANWGSFGYAYFQQAGVDRVFAFRLKFAIESFDKARIIAAADSTLRYRPKGKDQIIFIENHDTKRFASGVGRSIPKMKAGAALSILIGGVPLIYYGQELGMPGEQLKGMTDGNDIPIREAFEWYRSGHGEGMCFWYEGSGEWWKNSNVKPNDGISVEEQHGDPNSLLNYYRKLIDLRAAHGALAAGAYQLVPNANESVFSFLRFNDDERVLVVVNLSEEAQRVTLRNETGRVEPLLGEGTVRPSQGDMVLELPPFDVSVIRTY